MRQFWKRRKRLIIGLVVGLLLLIILAVASVLVPNYIICSSAKPYIYDDISQVEPAYVAVVPGCYVDSSGNLSAMLVDRVATGVSLYKAGKVKKLLLSGDHGRKAYDEVNSMRAYAEKMGIPPQDIFMDHAGFSTYESMYRARDIFQVKSAIITTQDFHLARSVYTARRLGMKAVGVKADRRRYCNMGYYNKRESLARVKAFVQVNITRPEPTFLGDSIPITGDGRKTHDLVKEDNFEIPKEQ